MTLGVAVIGSGDFARQHVLTLKAVKDARVTHVVGSDLGRAQSLAGLSGSRARPIISRGF